jgi:hypothetical protein
MELNAVPPETPTSIGPRRSSFSATKRRERLPWPKDQPFRILSIDGGGIKGIYPAAVLAQLEKSFLAGRSIVECFDMIAGTSTGGILALGLAVGRSAQELLQFYIRDGQWVFPPCGWWKRKWRECSGLAAPRYDQSALKDMLENVLGHRSFADAGTRLCIPAFEGHHGEVFIFKTPHHPDYRKDGFEQMTTIGLATSAAPTYYAALDSGGYRYVDGGIWANNPTMIGVVDALACFSVDPAQIRVLSLGCGAEPFVVDVKRANGGQWAWRHAIFAAMDLQSQNVIGQARLLVGPGNVVRMNANPKNMIALDDWIRAHQELPALALADVAEIKADIGELFCYGPTQPLRRFWPPISPGDRAENLKDVLPPIIA